ncbi:MAG: hypothetical protein NTV02_01280 [Candidatus Zambryskibacteria bacterium]|nr:hypothetical protein [Candidatus Zambryskibacteria bacterium]
MITSRRNLILGICIVIIPFLGFPSLWKTFFVVASGLVLVGFSVQINIPKKIVRKARRKETIATAFRESIMSSPRSKEKNTDLARVDTTEENEQ